MKAILSAIAGLLLLPMGVSAHELWFLETGAEGLPAKPLLFTEPTALGVYLIAATAIVFILLIALERRATQSRLAQWLKATFVFPFHARQILAAMLGVALLGNAVTGSIIAPNFTTPNTAFGMVLAVVSVIAGMGYIFFEWFWFEISLLTLALFAAFGAQFGIEAVSHELMIPGMAIFLLATSPRTWFKTPISMQMRRHAYAFMRILAGGNFLALAFVKWLHPELGLKIIADYHMNFMSVFGMSNDLFLYCVALTETLAALALIFNLFTRAFAMVLFPIFTLTVFVLGFKDLLGHLPIKALLACFVFYGSSYHPRHKTHMAGVTSQAFEKLPL